MEKRIFGELELAILNIFQAKGGAYTVREIIQALGREDKYTTVMTVMNRLVAKGALQRERQGLSFSYSLPSKKGLHPLFEKWRQKIFGGSTSLMISYLLESAKEEDLEQLEQWIEEAKRKGKR